MYEQCKSEEIIIQICQNYAHENGIYPCMLGKIKQETFSAIVFTIEYPSLTCEIPKSRIEKMRPTPRYKIV